MDDYAVETYKSVLSGRLKRFPRDFWKDDEHIKLSGSAAITRYLIEEVLHWDDATIKSSLCCKVFFKHKLKGMLCMLFNESAYAALNNAYPDRFKEWELSCTPRNFWNIETAKEATVWLFKEHLKMSDDEIKLNVTRKIFVDNGLDTMMHVVYGNNATLAISNAFPGLLN